jgi:hypothetical protein
MVERRVVYAAELEAGATVFLEDGSVYRLQWLWRGPAEEDGGDWAWIALPPIPGSVQDQVTHRIEAGDLVGAGPACPCRTCRLRFPGPRPPSSESWQTHP